MIIVQDVHLFPRFHEVNAIIYCLINAVDGGGNYALTKQVDVWPCMGVGGQCKFEYI